MKTTEKRVFLDRIDILVKATLGKSFPERKFCRVT